MNTPDDTRPKLLPDLLLRPYMLFWVWALPLAILLILNVSAWNLVEGELDTDQRDWAMAWGLFNLLNLLAAIGIGATLALRKKKVSPLIGALIVVIQCAYIWFTTFMTHDILPRSVTTWILPEDRLMFQQWTWVMPAAFYGVMVLAGFPLMRKKLTEAGISVGAIILAPLGIYVFGWMLSGIFGSLERFGVQVFVFFFIAATLILGIGIVRLLLLLFRGLFKEHAILQRTILVLLFALVMPLLGLGLNKSIHFPADYQDAWVYAFVVVNAILLVIPESRNPWANLVLFLGRCALFPFTLYFFLVFLPYLPLSLLAMIAAGSGFLILTPTVLFIVHIIRLRDNFIIGLPYGALRIGLMGILAALIIPGAITFEAWRLRSQLDAGLNWVYSPDTQSREAFPGSPQSVVEATLWMRDYKNGRYLPYLTEYRAWLMFDNMVLPDDKLARIYESFSGQKYEEGSFLGNESFGFFNWNGSNRDTRRMPNNRPPNRDVKLESATSQIDTYKGITETVVKLDMRAATGGWQYEYFTDFQLPEGVIISSFWLHIGEERVPGRIFEKKTALWVYQMIRDVTRRDPGLIYYTGQNSLNLHVFPLASNELRTIELELTYPEGYARSFDIDGHTVPLGDVSHVAQTTQSGDATLAVFNRPALDSLPLIQRKPYWHFIIDRSANGLEERKLFKALEGLRAYDDTISDAVFSYANYNYVSPTHHPSELLENPREIATPLMIEKLPQAGGFLPTRALMQALSEYEIEFLQTHSSYGHYPVFVLLTEKLPDTWPDAEDLIEFTEYVPETQGVLVATPEKVLALDWLGKAIELPDLSNVPPVGVLAAGESVRPIPHGVWNATFAFENPEGSPLQFLESEHRTFVNFTDSMMLDADSEYAQALDLMNQSVRVKLNPAELEKALPGLVQQSRELGVLIPQTSYIVVENSAQWKMLEKTEKEKLEANPELDIMETPEPGMFVLLGLLLAVECGRRKLGKHSWPRLKPNPL